MSKVASGLYWSAQDGTSTNNMISPSLQMEQTTRQSSLQKLEAEIQQRKDREIRDAFHRQLINEAEKKGDAPSRALVAGGGGGAHISSEAQSSGGVTRPDEGDAQEDFAFSAEFLEDQAKVQHKASMDDFRVGMNMYCTDLKHRLQDLEDEDAGLKKRKRVTHTTAAERRKEEVAEEENKLRSKRVELDDRLAALKRKNAEWRTNNQQ